jgi:hypothetical protein
MSSKAIMSIVANDQYTQNLVNKALEDFERVGKERGVEAQAQLCPQLLADNITKDQVINTFVLTKKEDNMRMKAYERTLGRRLTEKEVNDFHINHSTPALHAELDAESVEQLCRNLTKTRQTTKI